MTDGSGTLQDTYSDDAYGTTTSPPAQVQVPSLYGYIGGVRESRTGTCVMGERYYDPGTGHRRPDGRRIYEYANGNPIYQSDPRGGYPGYGGPGGACGIRLLDACNT